MIPLKSGMSGHDPPADTAGISTSNVIEEIDKMACDKGNDLTNGDSIRCDLPSTLSSKSNTPFNFPTVSVPLNFNASATMSNNMLNTDNNVSKSNTNPGSKPRSFLEAVARSSPAIASGARFAKPSHDVNTSNGMHSGDPSAFHVNPNPEMLNEIIKEKQRLRNIAIFFSAVEIDKVPARKFLDDWFHNYWNLKLGYQISFCRQIQKGLFVVFFNSNESQLAVLKKEYWTVGNTTFRALAWNSEANLDEVVALSAPRWILIKHIPPFLWRFIPQLVEPLGKFLRMDDSVRLVPHLDARVLIALKPGQDLPKELNITIANEVVSCPIETLGGLNACFLCRREGHLRKDCPIIRNKTQKNTNPLNPPISTQPIPPSSVKTNPLPSQLTPSQSFPSSLPTPSSQNVSFTSIVDSDGFQTVTRKRKNRSNKINSAPNLSFVPPPPVVSLSPKDAANPFVPSSSISKAPTKVLSSGPKSPSKKFQEIPDDFIVEVIPAISCAANNQSSELEASSPSLSDSEDILTAKRKGSPTGYKNKNKNNKKQNQTDSSVVSPMEDIVGAVASNSRIPSQ